MAFEGDSAEARSRAEQLLRRHEEMESERANLDPLYQRIAEYTSPESETFIAKNLQQGVLGGEKVFDNTPGLALDRFGSAIASYLVPDSDQWHDLAPSDPGLRDDEETKEYLEGVVDIQFSARYRPKTNFSAQMHACFRSLGAFGPWCLFVDEAPGAHLRYRALHLSEVYFGEDHQGLVDRVHRGRFKVKAYQAEAWVAQGKWAALSPRMRKALDDKKPNEEFEVIHCVYPNERIDPRRGDYRAMAFASTYIAPEERFVLGEGGYRTMPYAVGRYMTGPREVYGRSPAMVVLRDILMLSEMNKGVIRAAQNYNDPALLISEEGAVTPFSTRPGANNYGYITQDGTPLAQYLQPQGQLGISLELIQDRRTAINDGFFITLFQILVENPTATATEVLHRAQEKGQLLGPSMSRQQDALGTMIERELDILAEAGNLPPMPDRLRESLAYGADIGAEFTAPVNRLQQTDRAVGLLRSVEALAPAAQIDPAAFNAFKGKWGQIGRAVAEALGAPATLMNSDEEIAAIEEGDAKLEAAKLLVASAPQIGKTLKDVSQAQATAASVPQPIPLLQPQ